MDPVIDSDALEALEGQRIPRIPENFLVMGASGMLGSYFLEFMCELVRIQGSAIRIVAPLRSENQYLSALESHYRGSLTLIPVAQVKAILDEVSDWLVFHAASPASPENHIKDSMGLVETNIEYNLLLSKSLSRTGGHLVYLSSGEVYGPTPTIPTAEADFSSFDHLSARGSYPEAKRAGELILQSYSGSFGLNATVLRVYHTFGPGIDLDQSRIFSSIIRSIVNNQPITLRTNGASTRTFLYSADLAVAALTCAKLDGFRVVNVAGQREMTILEFAELASRLGEVGIELSDEMKDGVKNRDPRHESVTLRGFADTSLLQGIGWAQQISVEKAILRTVASVNWRISEGY